MIFFVWLDVNIISCIFVTNIFLTFTCYLSVFGDLIN